MDTPLQLSIFLESFPTDTNDWSKATDELPDFHNQLGECLSGYQGHVAVQFGGKMPDELRDKDPGARNAYHRRQIIWLVQQLDPETVKHVMQRHQEWFPPVKTFDPFNL